MYPCVGIIHVFICVSFFWPMKDMSVVHDYVHHNMRINFFFGFFNLCIESIIHQGCRIYDLWDINDDDADHVSHDVFFFEGYLPLHFLGLGILILYYPI